MFKKAITALVAMVMAQVATGSFAGEASNQPSIKKWQPMTPKVQAKQIQESKAKKSGTVMEHPSPMNEQVMEHPTPVNEKVMEHPAPVNEKVMESQAAKELNVGGKRQLQNRIGPGPIS